MFFKHIPHVISTFLRKFATKTTHKIMIIGRYEEVKILQTAAHADESKFVAVYGRRRVGKTFLVRETFNNTFAFYHTRFSKRVKSSATCRVQPFISALWK